MRIITGKLRGMQLFSPKNMDVRPTADRVKESVFNILGPNFTQATVLDLFAGSGNLGLESWSRGATQIVFADISNESLALLKKNIAKAKITSGIKIVKGDALKLIKKFFLAGEKFDYIFCDPPYNKGLVAMLLQALSQDDILKTQGLLIIEHSKEEAVDLLMSNKLLLFRKEKYGDTFVSFFKKE